MGKKHNVNNPRRNVLKQRRQKRQATKSALQASGIPVTATGVTTRHPKSAKRKRQLASALKNAQARMLQNDEPIQMELEADDGIDPEIKRWLEFTVEPTKTARGTTIGAPA